MEQEHLINEFVKNLSLQQKKQLGLGVPLLNVVTGDLLVSVNFNGIATTILLNIFK